MNQHLLSDISRALHNMISAYRVSIGQIPYQSWDSLPIDRTEFYNYAIEQIANDKTITAQQVHDLWLAWAVKHQVDHLSIVPFDQLSFTEKIKDELCIAIVRSILKYHELANNDSGVCETDGSTG